MRWIEELSTKQEDVGASKAIAVSRTGFSAAARSMAHSRGIDLRTFEDVSEEELSRWISFQRVIFKIHRMDGISLNFGAPHCNQERQGTTVLGQWEDSPTETKQSPKIIRATDGAVVTPQEIVRELRENGDLVPKGPVSRWPDGLLIKVSRSKYRYFIEVADKERVYLADIKLEGDFTAGMASLNPVRSLKYMGSESPLGLTSEVTVIANQGPVTISVSANADKTRYRIAAHSEDECKEIYLQTRPQD